MTEDEARQKWCPFVRVMYSYGEGDPGAVAASVNREGGVIPHDCRCIASDCMAWRYDPQATAFDAELTGKERPHGYCGLAGKP